MAHPDRHKERPRMKEGCSRLKLQVQRKFSPGRIRIHPDLEITQNFASLEETKVTHPRSHTRGRDCTIGRGHREATCPTSHRDPRPETPGKTLQGRGSRLSPDSPPGPKPQCGNPASQSEPSHKHGHRHCSVSWSRSHDLLPATAIK